MTNTDDVCMRWTDILSGSPKRQLKTGNVFVSNGGDTIYSYGTHFPMATALRNKDGSVRLILVNGDTYSNTTSRHQSSLRSAVMRSPFPSVIIPYEALRAASVDFSTITLIEATADRNEERHHRTFAQPAGSVWRTDPVMEYVDKTPAELQAICDRHNDDAMRGWEDRIRYGLTPTTPGSTSNFWADWLETRSVAEYPNEFTVDRIPHYQRQEWKQTGTVRRLYTGSRSRTVIDVDELTDGRTSYSWTTHHHWLGESVIGAKVRWEGRTPCKECKGRGRGLGPEPEGHDWRHQPPLCEACDGMRAKRWQRTRSTVFLSGFDHQEPRPLYFFCELPPGSKPTSVAEAYEMLKPDTVKLAEQMGRPVVRQGDIFAVSTSLDKRSLRKAGASFEKRGVLLGTNHVATEVAVLPDGTTLSRGTLTHAPDFRRPDHVRKALGTAWHITIKNTVPVSV